jgi:hypothetical protein
VSFFFKGAPIDGVRFSSYKIKVAHHDLDDVLIGGVDELRFALLFGAASVLDHVRKQEP